MIVGHSMGGMLAPVCHAVSEMTERSSSTIRLVSSISGSIGHVTDWTGLQAHASHQPTRPFAPPSCGRSHNPARGRRSCEKYTRVRYAWTLSADWPRLAMVQTLLGQVSISIRHQRLVATSKLRRWCLAEQRQPAGPAAVFKQRMQFVAERIPNGRGRLHLIPGVGHVPHLEAPEKTYPPLVAFLKEGLGK